MDLNLAWHSFEREALDSADDLVLLGVEVPVARGEDLLVYKAIAWRDQDRADIAHLVERCRDEIDLDRVRRGD